MVIRRVVHKLSTGEMDGFWKDREVRGDVKEVSREDAAGIARGARKPECGVQRSQE